MLICLIFSSNKNESIDTIIPCEYCGAQINIHDWTWHTVNK
jgi:hypothetical protein